MQKDQDPNKPSGLKKEKKIETHKFKPKKFSIFVATPVHSEVSIHYFQACLEFQKHCVSNNIQASFQVMKSSLVNSRKKFMRI